MPRITPYEELLSIVQTCCDMRVSAREGARVLDAGSGLQSYVEFPAHVRVTGVDVSRKLLDTNPRLDERIHADLQELKIPERAYDCVVCWEVLEHLEDPVPVVAKLSRAVADNGLLIIGSPNPQSVKGLVTRFTPHTFHVWVYRRFFDPEASEEPGKGPYPTFMKSGGGAAPVARTAEEAGLTSVYTGWVESPMQIGLRQRFRITGGIWRFTCWVISVFSLGRIYPDATDYLCIFERRAASGRHLRPLASAAAHPLVGGEASRRRKRRVWLLRRLARSR